MREWNPPAREPTNSDVGRRSTTDTSTPARASSPASIIPVGPPPATITSAIRTPAHVVVAERHVKQGRAKQEGVAVP